MKMMLLRNWLLVETLEYIDHNDEPAEYGQSVGITEGKEYESAMHRTNNSR